MGHLSRLLLVSLVLSAACGDNNGAQGPIDAAVDASAPITCGNKMLDPGEDCDDGDIAIDLKCTADCKYTCGNGKVDNVETGEKCDTGIKTGAGACPLEAKDCDDKQACTSDVRSGADCQAICQHAPITSRRGGDGCCPATGNANNDSDCPSRCGNAVREPGETCDTTIASGLGKCPVQADCNDFATCTVDTLNNKDTCTAACANTAITAPTDGDRCCPAGSPAEDSDCASCDNGVKDPLEECDTKIPAGQPDACPTSCPVTDTDACTTDEVADRGTCQARCVNKPVKAPINGDKCCPLGANSTNDNDCPVVCGNSVPEAGEDCDDGNDDPDDSCHQCTFVPAAFRFTEISIADPHPHAPVGVGCTDVGVLLSGLLSLSLNNDGRDALPGGVPAVPPDGFLDVSPTIVLRPLAQGAASTAIEVHFAKCTAPAGTTTCRPDKKTPPPGPVPPEAATTANNMNGTCLAVVPGSINEMYGMPTPAVGLCFVSLEISITLTLEGIPIKLQKAQVAAVYVGDPALSLADGLLRGFMTETDANETILPPTLPLVGGQRLSALLPGGDPPPDGGNDKNCATHSDKDMQDGASGWWWYINFKAEKATWLDTPLP